MEYKYDLSHEHAAILSNSFSELNPYLKSYRLEYHHCPKTHLSHASVVFTFQEDTRVDLSTLSDECKTMWRLHQMQDIFDKPAGKLWRDGCIMRDGVPPISRVIPRSIAESIFENPDAYHCEGGYDCFDPVQSQ